MTKRKRRAPQPAKPRPALRCALDSLAVHVDPSKQRSGDVTERLNALYGTELEGAAMDPLLTELQFRSLRKRWQVRRGSLCPWRP